MRRPRAGLCKDIRRANLRNMTAASAGGRGRMGKVVKVGGGRRGAGQPPPTSPNLHNLPNLLQILNGTGANVMTKSTSAAHASTRRDLGRGRCASRTGGRSS